MNIFQKLKTALAPLVPGPDANGQPCCYPNSMPQQPTYPALVYQLISEQPAESVTQLARYTDFKIQVTIHAVDYPTVQTLRSSVLAAAEAMPEYVTRDSGLEPPFEFEPKTYSWIIVFHFRDSES